MTWAFLALVLVAGAAPPEALRYGFSATEALRVGPYATEEACEAARAAWLEQRRAQIIVLGPCEAR